MLPVNGATENGGRSQRGGLNLWQWLGIAIILIAGGIYVYRNFLRTPPPPEGPDQTAPTQAQDAIPPSPDASDVPDVAPTRRPPPAEDEE